MAGIQKAQMPAASGFPAGPAQQPSPYGPTTPQKPRNAATPWDPNYMNNPGNFATNHVAPQAPQMMQDPNTGNNYQWNTGATPGTSSGWSLFSQGQQGNPFDFWGAHGIASNKVPQIPPRIPGVSPEDRQAAEAAAFGRAKDRIGMSTQGLLKSIRSNASRRGISGSPLAGGQEADALMAGYGQQGEVLREQAIQDLRRREAIQDQTYGGDINQRGQDISAEAQRQQMILALVTAARGSGRY
jgi:hypothetical protein